jgi:pyruvate dehydrogenase E1 component alpha subunit
MGTLPDILTWTETNDPIKRFEETLLKDRVLTGKGRQRVWDDVKAEMDAAVEFAEKSPFPDPEAAVQDLYANP